MKKGQMMNTSVDPMINNEMDGATIEVQMQEQKQDERLHKTVARNMIIGIFPNLGALIGFGVVINESLGNVKNTADGAFEGGF